MKLGLIITMYDEIDIVLQTMENVRKVFPDSIIIVVHSDAQIENENLNRIKEISNKYILLSDLSKEYHRWQVPSRSICRNVSEGCKSLYELHIDIDCIVIITGDTLISDALNIKRRRSEMIQNDWIAMVSQAIGSSFHSDDDDPPNGIREHRIQTQNTTDFMPQYILLNGEIANQTKVFSDIKITNKWTTEQCLGDEFMRILDNKIYLFKQKVGILNSNNRHYVMHIMTESSTTQKQDHQADKLCQKN